MGTSAFQKPVGILRKIDRISKHRHSCFFHKIFFFSQELRSKIFKNRSSHTKSTDLNLHEIQYLVTLSRQRKSLK
jgi:hypothetical protein